MNLRPPGPQPGALPDCATPRDEPIIPGRRRATGRDWTSDAAGRSGARGRLKRATGIEPALKAWKAFVQPQHFARGSGQRTAEPRRGPTGELGALPVDALQGIASGLAGSDTDSTAAERMATAAANPGPASTVTTTISP